MERKPTKKPRKTKRQRFTPEYKLEAVRPSEEGTKSTAAVAADLGIAANQLRRWRRQHADRGPAAFPGDGKVNSHDEERRPPGASTETGRLGSATDGLSPVSGQLSFLQDSIDRDFKSTGKQIYRNVIRSPTPASLRHLA